MEPFGMAFLPGSVVVAPMLKMLVCRHRSAKETETGREVAIKRVGARNFEEQILTKRAFRELKLLRHMNGHENVLIDFYPGALSKKMYLKDDYRSSNLWMQMSTTERIVLQNCKCYLWR